MRQKAERAIRRATESLESPPPYRLEEIRRGAGLIPKVFDKTILDMERVGTIELMELEVASVETADVSGMVRRGEIVYEKFRFIEEPLTESVVGKKPPAATVSITLNGVDASLWHRFERKCRELHRKPAMEVMLDFIKKTTENDR